MNKENTPMKLALIAAVANNNGIGLKNKLPWHLPNDLIYFREVTMGKPIIMGRKTFDSIKKPLPGRTNIVITKNKNWHHNGVNVAHNLQNATSLAKELALADEQDEIMVIGGAEIYRQAIDQADRIYLTKIHEHFDTDAFFPDIDQTMWREVSRKDMLPQANQKLAYSYIVLDRI